MSKEYGAKILEIVEQFEVPQEFHNALWEAYSAGAEMGFFKALKLPPKPLKKGSE